MNNNIYEINLNLKYNNVNEMHFNIYDIINTYYMNQKLNLPILRMTKDKRIKNYSIDWQLFVSHKL